RSGNRRLTPFAPYRPGRDHPLSFELPWLFQPVELHLSLLSNRKVESFDHNETTNDTGAIMKVNDRRRAMLIQGAAAMVGLPLATRVFAATAETGSYPEKPIKIVVPFAPGGPTDLMARAISRPMSENLGQTIVVINKPGGTGVIALSEVRNAPADGYTLAFPSIQAVTTPALRSDFPFDMTTDFTGVSVVGYISHLLVVNVKTPVNTLREFIDMVKARPSAYFYGSSGNGSSGHLAMEMFKDRAGIALEHTPYKGAAPAIDRKSTRLNSSHVKTS